MRFHLCDVLNSIIYSEQSHAKSTRTMLEYVCVWVCGRETLFAYRTFKDGIILKYIFVLNTRMRIAPQKYEHAKDMWTSTTMVMAQPNYYLNRDERMFIGFIFL